MYRDEFYKKYLTSVNYLQDNLEKNFDALVYFNENIEKTIPKNKNIKVLDIGCGYGSFLNTLKKRGYKNLFGVEKGEEQIKFLNSKGLNVFNLDIFEFLKNDKNNQYDLITMFDVLEHFNKDEVVLLLSQIKEKLTDNVGLLIIRVPNGEAIFKGSIMYGDFTHETFFTKRSLIQIFNTYGFKEIEVYPDYQFGKSFKAKIAKLVFLSFVKLYKTLLYIEHHPSIEYFVPTQNIIGIIKK